MTTPNIRELRRQRARRHAGAPVILKILIALASLYLVYLLAGFFVAPSVLKTQIERRASVKLKRDVRVGRATFNPFTFTVRLEKVVVRDRDGQQLLGWGQLLVNVRIFSLFADEIRFSEILLDGFSARLVVSKEGILNVADLVSPAPTSSGSKSWIVAIDRLTVNRAEIDYSDASRVEPFSTHIGPTTFVLQEFRTSGGPGAPGVFRAVSEAGESIEWSGRLGLAPLHSNGEVRLARIILKKYAPFYEGLVHFDVLNGTLDAQVPYEFSIQQDKPQLKITEAAIQTQGLEISERGKSEPVISLKNIEVAHAAFDLQGNAVDVRQLSLGGGSLLIRRVASGINLATFFPPSANAPTGKGSTTGASPALTAKLDEIVGKEFTVSVEDKATPRPAALQLNHASFSLKHFSLQDLATALPFDFRADLAPGGGTVHLEGQASPSPLKLDLAFAIEGASLPVFSPWMEVFSNLRLTEGVAGLRGQIHARPGTGAAAPVITVTSEAELSSLAATDAQGEPLVTWKALTLRGAEYTSAPARLTLSEISLADPSIKLTRNRDHVLNVSTLLRQNGASKPLPTVAAGTGPTQFIAIDRLAITNASLTYLDQSVEPTVTTSVDQFSGTITGMTSAAIDRADLKLAGRIGGSAPLTIVGKVNLLSNSLAADIEVELKDSDLMPFASYVGKFTGYELASGALSLDSKAKVNGGKLDSTTSLVVANFALGAPTNSPDALHVPIHLALSLLKDREGKIVLPDLPAQGSLNDPNFQISGVIMHVVGNLITKAATSPFSLVGSLFGGGRSGEDLSFQDFTPGSSQLAESNSKKLDVIARALHERPALHLAVVGGADPVADLLPMRERELEVRIRTALWEEERKVDNTLDTPDKVTVSRAGADRILGLFYQDAFAPAPAETVATPVTPTAATPPPRRGFFLFRWFTRSKPATTAGPPPAIARAPAPPPVARAPAPTAGRASTPAQPGGPAIAAEYGKVIGAEYGTVIGADVGPRIPLPSVSEMRARLLEAIPIGEPELRKLAGDRAEKVRDYMVNQAQVSPEQLEIAIDASAKGGTRASLQLK